MANSLVEVSGSWTSNCRVGDEEVWNADTEPEVTSIASHNPLPSDCHFREDLIELLRSHPDDAAKWKINLENQQ